MNLPLSRGVRTDSAQSDTLHLSHRDRASFWNFCDFFPGLRLQSYLTFLLTIIMDYHLNFYAMFSGKHRNTRYLQQRLSSQSVSRKKSV